MPRASCRGLWTFVTFAVRMFGQLRYFCHCFNVHDCVPRLYACSVSLFTSNHDIFKCTDAMKRQLCQAQFFMQLQSS